MTDKEKILKGVWLHFSEGVICSPDCPYRPYKDDGCTKKLVADIEAVIKAVPDENTTFCRLIAEKTDLMDQITELKRENKSIRESYTMLLKLCLILGERK